MESTVTIVAARLIHHAVIEHVDCATCRPWLDLVPKWEAQNDGTIPATSGF